MRRDEYAYGRPWNKRVRLQPARTWSGKVTYKRPKHYFSVADVQRIMQKTSDAWEIERPSANTLELLLATVLSFWIKTFNTLAWIDPFHIARKLANAAQEVIQKLVGIDNDPWDAWVVLDTIYTLASKQNKYDIAIKWRP